MGWTTIPPDQVKEATTNVIFETVHVRLPKN